MVHSPEVLPVGLAAESSPVSENDQLLVLTLMSEPGLIALRSVRRCAIVGEVRRAIGSTHTHAGEVIDYDANLLGFGLGAV